MIKYDEEEFRRVCSESKSMNEASVKLGIHFNTLRRIAKKLNCYKKNQGLKGTPRLTDYKIPLTEILDGKHPSYQTYKLKQRLIEEGIKKNECEIQSCKLSSWLGNPLNCELDHIDGDRFNHKLENLRMICPNCHSQTETYRARNIKRVLG
jgi:hypothetical protein